MIFVNTNADYSASKIGTVTIPTSETVVSIQIYAANGSSAIVGDTAQFKCKATYGDGSTRDITATSYSVSDASGVCSMSNSGLLTINEAAKANSVTVKAVYGNLTSSMSATITFKKTYTLTLSMLTAGALYLANLDADVKLSASTTVGEYHPVKFVYGQVLNFEYADDTATDNYFTVLRAGALTSENKTLQVNTLGYNKCAVFPASALDSYKTDDVFTTMDTSYGRPKMIKPKSVDGWCAIAFSFFHLNASKESDGLELAEWFTDGMVKITVGWEN